MHSCCTPCQLLRCRLAQFRSTRFSFAKPHLSGLVFPRFFFPITEGKRTTQYTTVITLSSSFLEILPPLLTAILLVLVRDGEPIHFKQGNFPPRRLCTGLGWWNKPHRGKPGNPQTSNTQSMYRVHSHTEPSRKSRKISAIILYRFRRRWRLSPHSLAPRVSPARRLLRLVTRYPIQW